ncbi:hypothetical protein [Butyrivibrio sp. MB2005]|uniref:hypothetical protein n=1 Tax=Butyrivibrio sp. MB2005 TaxID=1280678 RepID=UPI0003FF0757|nr:hypothetical protein [Butyrivibrio sp. MB2005]
MRVSRHNGRCGKNGSYNSKHNDREFDVSNAENIKEDLTPYNVYWNCIDRVPVFDKDRDENCHTFTEAEKEFYDLCYTDYIDGQNERNKEARHLERCRTTDDLRTDKRTCPEETIYQIGSVEETIEHGVLLEIVSEFMTTMQERYGSNVHILDWALHIDESTPHIHERHVFDVTNKYGERQPKQEKALKQLGFELPDPSKPQGRYNNRKMSYDAECRKLLIDICKKHGLEIIEEPMYGGKKYQEKQEYIITKINGELSELRDKLSSVQMLYDEALVLNENLSEKNGRLSAENEKLTLNNDDLATENKKLLEDKSRLEAELEKKQVEISDIDTFASTVASHAYDKACEKLVGEIASCVTDEESKELDRFKSKIQESTNPVTKVVNRFALEQLTIFQNGLTKIKDRVIKTVRKTFASPSKKTKLQIEIAEGIKPSLLKDLHVTVRGIRENKEADSISHPKKPRTAEQSL